MFAPGRFFYPKSGYPLCGKWDCGLSPHFFTLLYKPAVFPDTGCCFHVWNSGSDETSQNDGLPFGCALLARFGRSVFIHSVDLFPKPVAESKFCLRFGSMSVFGSAENFLEDIGMLLRDGQHALHGGFLRASGKYTSDIPFGFLLLFRFVGRGFFREKRCILDLANRNLLE